MQLALDNLWRRRGHAIRFPWFTGLSCSGKTTLALNLELLLFGRGWLCCVLDGDNVRNGLSSDLGFSQKDREENIRRVGEVANLLAQPGKIAFTAFISPYRADCGHARQIAGNAFHEIYLYARLEVCEQRDSKGLYVKARRWLIPDLTGISEPYEAPAGSRADSSHPGQGIEDCFWQLEAYVEKVFPLKDSKR